MFHVKHQNHSSSLSDCALSLAYVDPFALSIVSVSNVSLYAWYSAQKRLNVSLPTSLSDESPSLARPMK